MPETMTRFQQSEKRKPQSKRCSALTNQAVWGRLAAIAICEAVGVAGAVTTRTGDSPWYRMLKKPKYQPPAYVFAPVWTVLYALMGLSLYELWERRDQPGGKRALQAFSVQLVLNGIWTPVFFGLRSLRGGMGIILALWAAIVVTIIRAQRVSRPAAALLLPYLGWVSFATVLNGSILRLNHHRERLLSLIP